MTVSQLLAIKVLKEYAKERGLTVEAEYTPDGDIIRFSLFEKQSVEVSDYGPFIGALYNVLRCKLFAGIGYHIDTCNVPVVHHGCTSLVISFNEWVEDERVRTSLHPSHDSDLSVPAWPAYPAFCKLFNGEPLSEDDIEAIAQGVDDMISSMSRCDSLHPGRKERFEFFPHEHEDHVVYTYNLLGLTTRKTYAEIFKDGSFALDSIRESWTYQSYEESVLTVIAAFKSEKDRLLNLLKGIQ